VENKFSFTRKSIQWITVVAVGALTVGSAVAEEKHSNATPQCSVALVSSQVPAGVSVCDVDTVKKLAAQGHVYEQNQLWMASVLAIGPGFNTQSAIQWFERAAKNGYAPAQVNLGVIYANGWATPQNYAAALQWFNRAAEQRYARAYYNLGVLYLRGSGVRQDYAEAVRYFKLGSDAGDASATANLGYMYDRGLGVAADPVTAFTLYRQAAEKGDAMGENNVADMYLRGIGVAQNDLAAFRWFQKAAEQGNTASRIKFGYMLSEGRGGRKDIESAYSWIAAADMAGDNRGKELLRSLEGKLSQEQLEHSKKRAAELNEHSNEQFRASLQP